MQRKKGDRYSLAEQVFPEYRTPFTISYGCLIPAQTDGLLVCVKNISVLHITNGATRLQPVVIGIDQAAGMAAAMCVELNT